MCTSMPFSAINDREKPLAYLETVRFDCFRTYHEFTLCYSSVWELVTSGGSRDYLAMFTKKLLDTMSSPSEFRCNRYAFLFRCSPTHAYTPHFPVKPCCFVDEIGICKNWLLLVHRLSLQCLWTPCLCSRQNQSCNNIDARSTNKLRTANCT